MNFSPSGLLFFALAVASGVCGDERASFNGHKVYRVRPVTQEQVQSLNELHDSNFELDFWRRPSLNHMPHGLGHADIRVPPRLQANFTRSLKSHGIPFNTMIDDVQRLIDDTMPKESDKPRKFGDINYAQYNTFETVDAWVQELPTKYSHIAKLVVIGKTYEGRTLHAIHISGKSSNSTKPAFWMDGGIHAREWISPATVIYMLGNILSGYGQDEKITNLVDSIDFYILPVFNADGYVYTWEHNRMWRKTRKPNPGSHCVGTDPNRNWDWHWCEAGSSKDPCTDDYCGSAAFSEICVKAVADYLKTIPHLQVYINFHSYSQMWMYPWGYEKAVTKDYSKQDGGAAATLKALEAVHGTKYVKGPIAETIYPASGSTADWTYGAIDVVYSYGVELRDKGQHGFILPADQIIPSGQETLAGIVALGEYVLNNQE